MRKGALLIGAGLVLLVAGGLVSTGVVEFDRTETVAELGPVKITKTERESPPVNLGYVLLGVGAVAVVAGLVVRR